MIKQKIHSGIKKEKRMKKMTFISMAAQVICASMFALGLASCAKETQDEAELQETKMVTVSLVVNAPESQDPSESGTKSSVGDAGAFSWESGDAISVYVSGCATESDNKFYKFTTTDSGTSASFTGTIPEDGTISGYAVYPYDESHSYDGTDLKVNIPSAVSSSKWGPVMFADLSGSTVTFQHLAALVEVSYSNIPTSTSGSFTISSSSNLSGVFSVNTSEASLTADSGNGTSVVFTPSDISGDQDFYVTVPAGTHDLSIELDYDGTTLSKSSSSRTYTKGYFTKLPVIKVAAPDNLYIVGGACVTDNDWSTDMASWATFTNEGSGVFTWTGPLKASEQLKFYDEGGTGWGNGHVYGAVGSSVAALSSTSQTVLCGSGGLYNFEVAEDGTYLVTVTFASGSISVTASKLTLYPIGAALTDIEWTLGNSVAMTCTDGVFTWTGKMKPEEEFKFLTQQDWGAHFGPAVNDTYVIDGANNIYYHADGDYKFKRADTYYPEGTYTITIDMTGQPDTITITQ